MQVLIGIALAAAAVGAGQACEQFLWSPRDTPARPHDFLDRILADRSLRFRPRVPAGVGRTGDVSVHRQGLTPMLGLRRDGVDLVFVGAVTSLFTERPTGFPTRFCFYRSASPPCGWRTLRIALLVGVGVWISPKVAVQGFHSQAGWLAFNGIALGLVLASRHIVSSPGPIPARGGRVHQSHRRLPGPAPGHPCHHDDYWGPYGRLRRVLSAPRPGSGCRPLVFSALLRRIAMDLVLDRSGDGVATFALWMALEPTTAATATEDTLGAGLARLGPVWSTVWLVFRVVGSVVTVPLAEELAFRGST